MSGGKIQKENESSEDNILVLISKIQNEIDNLKKKSEDPQLFNKIAALEIDVDDIDISLMQHFEICHTDFAAFHSILDSQATDLELIKNSLKDIKKVEEQNSNGFLEAISRVENRHRELKDSSVNKEDHNRLESKQKIDMQKVESKIDSIEKKIVSLESKIASLTDLFGGQKYSIDRLLKESDCVPDMIQSIERVHSTARAHLEEKIERTVAFVSNFISSEFAKMKMELAGSPSSFESAKSEIEKKMQSIELDASNAVLKSSNADQQIKLLERKIENISLQLKNYELSKR